MTPEQIAALVKALQTKRARAIDTAMTEAQQGNLYRCPYWHGHADAYKAALELLEDEGVKVEEG